MKSAEYGQRLIDLPVNIPPQPWQVQPLMEACCLWYEEQKSEFHPVTLAAEIHERIVTILSFIDGNGRTARFVINLILLSN